MRSPKLKKHLDLIKLKKVKMSKIIQGEIHHRIREFLDTPISSMSLTITSLTATEESSKLSATNKDLKE